MLCPQQLKVRVWLQLSNTKVPIWVRHVSTQPHSICFSLAMHLVPAQPCSPAALPYKFLLSLPFALPLCLQQLFTCWAVGAGRVAGLHWALVHRVAAAGKPKGGEHWAGEQPQGVSVKGSSACTHACPCIPHPHLQHPITHTHVASEKVPL